jgi:hypothetical protein
MGKIWVITEEQSIQAHNITSPQNSTTMNTPRVSREQAEMLKKVGYDVPCTHCYLNGNDRMPEWVPKDYNRYDNACSAPTLDEAARWLREVKGWHVMVLMDTDRKWGLYVMTTEYMLNEGKFDTHDLALSAGIDLILKKVG